MGDGKPVEQTIRQPVLWMEFDSVPNFQLYSNSPISLTMTFPLHTEGYSHLHAGFICYSQYYNADYLKSVLQGPQRGCYKINDVVAGYQNAEWIVATMDCRSGERTINHREQSLH
ncbi:hypothetical protein QJS10_CPA01g01753 [Acorus calamus]|uniref:Uncharacterized protein n=1 Tax=Acorus calamus TaxID=4465 RepID=A0AAV9FH81_ACOCL|nr:hypothetical protein QJS10_CPA01g01753 [Acorus calamus]